jgi:cell division protein YceG involved in septum cleavage
MFDRMEAFIMTKIFVNNNKIMLTIGAIVFLSFFLIGGMGFVQADESTKYEKNFITIEVHPGDTLTSYAEEYAISPATYQDYIEEIKSINNLKDDTIHSGCYLLIPVYEG